MGKQWKSSVQFSHSVVSNSFWPHGLQHARLPGPSPTPRSCSNSCPLSWWCHPTISSLSLPSPAFNLTQLQGLFQCVYLRLLIFLPAILIPACASSSPACLMMCSAYKLNKQGDNIQPWHTPFPIWNQSVVPCPVLTIASWLAYRFLKRPWP